MSRFLKDSWLITLLSFTLVVALMEITMKKVSANLPVDPGKWPRIEIAQKLDLLDRGVAKRKSFEVIFVGSSVMAGGVDPVEFTEVSGVSSFNAAWAGATARTSSLWAQDVIEPLAHPQVIVLGIQSGELNDNGPKNRITYRKFLRSPGYEQTTSLFIRRVERWLQQLSDFIRYRLIFRTPTSLFGRDRAALEATKVRQVIGERGRRDDKPTSYRFTKKFQRNFYAKNLVNLQLGGREYRAVVRLHRELEERGAKLVVIGTPVTDDYYSVHADPVGDRAEFQALLRRLNEEAGVTVINAADAFPNSIPFRDPVHLDHEGRVAFSNALAEDWDSISAHGPGWFEVDCRGPALRPTCDVTGGSAPSA